MGTKSLVALDTDHIKQYVFATDKLKEIRGASSILDRLNRYEMKATAERIDPEALLVYANGGSGLFVIDSHKAQDFQREIQRKYREWTRGGASITCVVQDLPPHVKENLQSIEAIKDVPIKDELDLMRCKLREEKDSTSDQEVLVLPSHPLMRTCDACGSRYAEKPGQEPGGQEVLLCASCWEKRSEDQKVKNFIEEYVKPENRTQPRKIRSPLWNQVVSILRERGYAIPDGTNRPEDFNDFRRFAAKGYIGLIYADGNNMGTNVEEFSKLREIEEFADKVDSAIYKAVCDAIKEHLPVWIPPEEEKEQGPLFQFDLLLLGGDDVVMITPAPVALQVARTIAERFYRYTENKYAVSIGVVLAPLNYPFGMLQDLAESTLRYAKKVGVKRQGQSMYGDTFINFMTVTGSTSHDFGKVYNSLKNKHVEVKGHRGDVELYATLRPYTIEELGMLIEAIHAGRQQSLGRTKLHQIREAVLEMNLSTSVFEGMAILNNWNSKQRELVTHYVYKMGQLYQARHSDASKPGTLFSRVTFPWFADGPNVYRTPLLDFVELYDFIAQEGGNDGAED